MHRLSTRVPGLGNATGLIVPTAEWMTAAAARDPELADFVRRTQSFYRSWAPAYANAGPTAFPRGCGWIQCTHALRRGVRGGDVGVGASPC